MDRSGDLLVGGADVESSADHASEEYRMHQLLNEVPLPGHLFASLSMVASLASAPVAFLGGGAPGGSAPVLPSASVGTSSAFRCLVSSLLIDFAFVVVSNSRCRPWRRRPPEEGCCPSSGARRSGNRSQCRAPPTVGDGVVGELFRRRVVGAGSDRHHEGARRSDCGGSRWLMSIVGVSQLASSSV